MSKILFFGEPLIRITPLDYKELTNDINASIQYGGTEVNIAKNMCAFNINTSLLTGLPKDSIGDSFIRFLNQYKIDTSFIQRCGQRIGTYYLIQGYGIRQSEVYYDRQFTSINDLNISDIDFDLLFNEITHFHFSGITIAVSQNVRDTLLVLLQEAKKRNIIVSLDLNLRTKMISIEDAKHYFSQFAYYADYCFGIDPLMLNYFDISMFNRTNATEYDIEKRMKDLQIKFGFKAIFHTMRYIDHNQNNHYQCYGYQDKLYKSISLQTPSLERVGSGDAFVSGALYKIMNQTSMQEVIDFAVAAGTMKCTIIGDSMNESVSSISSLLNKHNEISR